MLGWAIGAALGAASQAVKKYAGSSGSSGSTSSSKPKSSSGGGGSTSSGGSSLIPIRSTFESDQYSYGVHYDPTTGVITLTDPSTGRTGTIQPGAYTMRDGSAYINPAYVESWLNPPSSGTAPQPVVPEEPVVTPEDAYLELLQQQIAQAQQDAAYWREQAQYQPPPPQTYTPPAAEPMSWEEALSRAQALVNPEAELARQQLLEAFAQRRELLPYQLAGRGQLVGGLAEGGRERLTQAEARAMNEIELRRQAMSQQLAESIRAGDEARVAQELDRAFKTWATQYQMELQRYGQLSQQQYQQAMLYQQRVASLYNQLWQLMTYPDEMTRQAVNDAANLLGGWLNIIDSPLNIEVLLEMLRGWRVS